MQVIQPNPMGNVVMAIQPGDFQAFLADNGEVVEMVGGHVGADVFESIREAKHPGAKFPPIRQEDLVQCWVSFSNKGTWDLHDKPRPGRYWVTVC